MGKRKVMTLSGMTTSGKSTFASKLEETGCFEEVTSFTTRAIRPGEIDGVHYNFITHEEAEAIIEEGKAVDSTFINGNYYGNSKDSFDEIFNKGKVPMIVCDPVGPKNLEKNKEIIDAEVYAVFIDAEPETLAGRMLDRMISEQSYIKELTDASLEEGLEYQEKYKKEYSNRLSNMSDFDRDTIEDIFVYVDNYLDDQTATGRTNIIEMLKSGFSAETSKEFQWKTDFDYAKVMDAEFIEANEEKAIKELNEALCPEKKTPKKAYGMSL